MDRTTPYSRRAILAGLALAPAAMLVPPARAARKLKPVAPVGIIEPALIVPPDPAYTALTAPDAAGREILANALDDYREWAADGAEAFSRNFAQLVEQNFARMDPFRAARTLSGMSTLELSHLAQAYTNRTAESGRPARLLDLMAVRMDPGQLSVVSQHFGFVPTYEAVWRAAPEKLGAFESVSSPLSPAPVLGAPFVSGGSKANTTQGPFDQYLDMTVRDIYLSFRNAPIGSTSVAASLYQAGVVLSYFGARVAAPIAFTYYVIMPAVAEYMPETYNSIGWFVNEMVTDFEYGYRVFSGDDLTFSDGRAEKGAAPGFGLGPTSMLGPVFPTTGGDFKATSSWAALATFLGGGRTNCEYCHRL